VLHSSAPPETTTQVATAGQPRQVDLSTQAGIKASVSPADFYFPHFISKLPAQARKREIVTCRISFYRPKDDPVLPVGIVFRGLIVMSDLFCFDFVVLRMVANETDINARLVHLFMLI
jgi:hypothetical protein